MLGGAPSLGERGHEGRDDKHTDGTYSKCVFKKVNLLDSVLSGNVTPGATSSHESS